jgi:hypothetical protein
MVLIIDQPTFSTLRMLQDSLNFMLRDPSKYKIAIEKEKRLFKYIIKDIYNNNTIKDQ